MKSYKLLCVFYSGYYFQQLILVKMKTIINKIQDWLTPIVITKEYKQRDRFIIYKIFFIRIAKIQR